MCFLLCGGFTLPETDSFTDTDTDSYNMPKSYTGTNTDSDIDVKKKWKQVKFHLISTDIDTNLGAAPICIAIGTCIGIGIAPLYTILNITIQSNFICVGIGIGIGIVRCKDTIRNVNK